MVPKILNERNKLGTTTLDSAMRNGSCPWTVIDLLISNGADPKLSDLSNSIQVYVKNGGSLNRDYWAKIGFMWAWGASLSKLDKDR